MNKRARRSKRLHDHQTKILWSLNVLEVAHPLQSKFWVEDKTGEIVSNTSHYRMMGELEGSPKLGIPQLIERVPQLARQGHALRAQVAAAIAFSECRTEVHAHTPHTWHTLQRSAGRART